MKLRMFTGLAVIFAMCLLLLTGCTKAKIIDAKEISTVDAIGSNGTAIVKASVDVDKWQQLVIGSLDNEEDRFKVAMSTLSLDYQVISDNENLSNGDIVEIELIYDEKTCKEAGIEFENTRFNYTVEGLSDESKYPTNLEEYDLTLINDEMSNKGVTLTKGKTYSAWDMVFEGGVNDPLSFNAFNDRWEVTDVSLKPYKKYFLVNKEPPAEGYVAGNEDSGYTNTFYRANRYYIIYEATVTCKKIENNKLLKNTAYNIGDIVTQMQYVDVMAIDIQSIELNKKIDSWADKDSSEDWKNSGFSITVSSFWGQDANAIINNFYNLPFNSDGEYTITELK